MKKFMKLMVKIFLIMSILLTGVGKLYADEEDMASLFEGIKLAKIHKYFHNHNPIMTHRFGADPYALVYKDRVYVYMTHDIIQRNSKGEILENDYGRIHTLNRLSSADLVNWTDHGTIDIGRRYTGKARWADKSWAPAIVYKNIDGQDKFFLYFADNANGIGVLTSDNPVGPLLIPLVRPWFPVRHQILRVFPGSLIRQLSSMNMVKDTCISAAEYRKGKRPCPIQPG